MSISSLRLKGFKSFGTQCDFTFSQNFTAIVGPNGSGKSNILDALKWILGEGSASGLRITRQSDLLFQGSSSSPPALSAEVSLRLTNDSERANLRRIFTKEGSSLYLDGKRILLQELDGVKQRFNLEGEGFALIGQGEISQTIHQRPKERRRQLDSLFGIERYREKRDDTLRRLDDAKSEALRIQTLIDELNARRQEISADVEKAVNAQGIIDSLEILRHDYYFVRRYANEKELADSELQRHILLSRLESLERWQKLWAFGLRHYEEKLKASPQNNSFTSQLETLASKKDSIQRKAFRLSTQAKSIKSRRESLLQELDTLRIQQEALSQERQRTHSEHENLRLELGAKQQEFSQREENFRQSQKESQRITERRKKILDDIAGLKLRKSRNESEITASESQRESLSQEIENLQSEQESRQQNLSLLTERKNNLQDSYTHLIFSHQQTDSKIQALRRELSHTESQLSHIFTAGSYPEPVRIILQSAEKNLIRSKPVIVADVFKCSSPDVAEAVEAFLGGRQYWLLVHTMEEAQEGVDFLKKHMAGRATYLALERCRERTRDYRLAFGDGVTGWAMDLVNVADEWRPAISHIMGDLLIVSDYRTGTEIIRAGAKFPVATCEGDIFATGGTITGGALRNKSGAVTSRQKADELSRKISELAGTLETLSESERRIRIDAEEAESALQNLTAEINSESRSLNAVSKNLERLRNDKAESESHSQKLAREIHDMAGKIESLESELSRLPDVTHEDYDSLLAPLRNEIRLLSERLNVTRTLYERVDSEYEKISAGIVKAESEISAGIETERISRAELFTLSQEKKKLYREEMTLRREIAKHNDEFAGAMRRIESLRKKFARSSENVSAMRNNISQAEAKISHLESECSQLIDLWEEKYPYDRNEARDTEGGRELTSSLRKLERELKSLGAYNLGAISEDQSLAERIDFLTDQLDDVKTSADELKALIDDTDSQVERSFTDSMARIDSRFNELFVRLFGGGEARLILQEADSVWDKGVEIFARPPGKKLQNISQLSGGEQSLTSIALIFATLEAAGSSLAVLDEVDAALDEYNLVRFAELAREYSQRIQIIAMTHRRATMERANLIYGVTMIEAGLSAVVGIDPENYA